MQNDLISRSELLKNLKEWADSNAMRGYDTAYDVVQECIATVENQPTVCDVQNVSWIYGEGRFRQEELYKRVEAALGFKLFFWQKSYIEMGIYRRFGDTTAKCLKELLEVNGQPLDYTKRPRSPVEQFLRNEMREIQSKLTEAGISTRTIFWCEAEKKKYNEILKKY